MAINLPADGDAKSLESCGIAKTYSLRLDEIRPNGTITSDKITVTRNFWRTVRVKSLTSGRQRRGVTGFDQKRTEELCPAAPAFLC
jgi:hypothetical protein